MNLFNTSLEAYNAKRYCRKGKTGAAATVALGASLVTS